jgi:hypothetical protein
MYTISSQDSSTISIARKSEGSRTGSLEPKEYIPYMAPQNAPPTGGKIVNVSDATVVFISEFADCRLNV